MPEIPPPIQRPNGQMYRPRKVAAYFVADADDLLGGVMVLGTHDLERAQVLADEFARWQLDDQAAAGRPEPGWYREGYESGEYRWVSDEARGAAGIWFRDIVEAGDGN